MRGLRDRSCGPEDVYLYILNLPLDTAQYVVIEMPELQWG
jgi:hypothetical protein